MFEWFVAKRFLFKDHMILPKGSAKIGVIAVAIGLAVMLIAMATARGLQFEVKKKLESFQGTFKLVSYDTGEALDSSHIAMLNAIEGDFRSHKVSERIGVLRNEIDYAGLLFKGVFSDFEATVWESYLVQGDWLQYENQDQVVVSEEVARQLGLEIGDVVYGLFPNNENPPQQRRMIVHGIYNSYFAEFDQSVVFVSGELVGRLNRYEADQFEGLEVFLKDSEDEESVYQAFLDRFPAHIEVVRTKDERSILFNWLALFDVNLLIISLVLSVVGAMNIITSLLAVVFERSNAIGLFRALGANERSVRKLFWIQGSYYLGLGLLIGNAIGLLLYAIQFYTHWLTFSNPEEYYITYIPVKLDVSEVLLLNAMVFGLSAMVLWLVSRIAVRMTITKLIRG